MGTASFQSSNQGQLLKDFKLATNKLYSTVAKFKLYFSTVLKKCITGRVDVCLGGV